MYWKLAARLSDIALTNGQHSKVPEHAQTVKRLAQLRACEGVSRPPVGKVIHEYNLAVLPYAKLPNGRFRPSTFIGTVPHAANKEDRSSDRDGLPPRRRVDGPSGTPKAAEQAPRRTS